MRWLFLLLVFASTPCFGIDSIHNRKKNPLVSSHHPLTPKVNIQTGEYMEEECDLMVYGCEPLSCRRYYSHCGGYHPVYTFWRFNPEQFCVGNLEWSKLPQFFAVGEKNGNVTSFDGKPSDTSYNFNLNKHTSFAYQPSENNHPLNTKVQFTKTDFRRKSDHNDYFRYQGEVIQGTGAKKYFISDQYCWTSYRTLFDRFQDQYVGYGPDIWSPFELVVYEEKRPNGNVICYTYHNEPACDGFPVIN